MGSYRVEWKRSAAKELKKLPRKQVSRILHAVERLAEEPYPIGSKKIVGAEHTFRLRVGVYRIIYSVRASHLVIEIVRVKHRKDVYK